MNPDREPRSAAEETSAEERSSSSSRLRSRALLLSLPLLIALLELLAGARIRARVPERGDLEAAAAFLRPRIEERVRVVAAPEYADPLVREALGDALTFAAVAPSDLAPFESLYAVSVNGHFPKEAPPGLPEVEAVFGRVSVLRWDLGPSPVVTDLVDHLSSARVEWVRGESVRPCVATRRPHPSPGGLGRGPMRPASRFVCDRSKPHLFVGETIVEDLSLAPRRAVHQHPPDVGTIRTTFEPLELSTAIVLYAGLYYEHERDGAGAPFEVVVRVDGRERGRLVHRDRQGWKRLVIDTRDLRGQRGVVSVETLARDATLRTASWSATIRTTEPDEAER